ncbi:MAG: hypothetical protein RL594_1401 [Bacteroidota bacterium]
MNGIRTLFFAIILALGAIVSSAQVTVYVRSAADGGNNANTGLTAADPKLTIGGVDGALTVGGVTALDIGAGQFAGAEVAVPLTINGANAGAALANWGEATTLTSPITLAAPDADVVFDGVTFGVGSTITGASAGANVIISNCTFTSAATINTAGLGWEELSISGSRFDGDDGVAPDITTAIIASGVSTFFLTETTFNDYINSAVQVTGTVDNVVITYNEMTNVNTANSSSHAAVTLDVAGLSADGSARIQNNIFAEARNGVTVSGALAGKTVSVETNAFTPGLTGHAIKNSGTGMLSAGCNYYGDVSIQYIMGVLTGSGGIQAGPYQTGMDQAGIGYNPNNGLCNGTGPVTITGSENSYFRIQDGVSAVAAGGTVTAAVYTYNENVTVNKSVSIYSTDLRNYIDRGDAPWTTINGTVTVTIGASSVYFGGLKFTSSSATQLLTSSATTITSVSSCWLAVDPIQEILTVPTNGAVHILKNGEISIANTKISRPSGVNEFIRALTFGAGNACRIVNVTSSRIEGTLQFSGMSLLSVVTVAGNEIVDAGTDGVSFTGNLINSAAISNNDILNSRQNGIGIRDRVTVGNVSATFNNNEITGSGASGSTFAAVSISNGSFGTQTYTNNILHPQAGSNKVFINGRSGYAPTATCNWWGSKSQDVIEASITGGVVLDNGTNGWRRSDGSNGGIGANFNGDASCSVRAFTITLAPSNASCFGSATGSVNTTLDGTFDGAAFSWSNDADSEDLSNIVAGTYTVTVTTASENSRSKSATVLEPTELSGISSKTNITCFGADNGGIKVSNAAGGLIPGVITTQAYQYRLDKVDSDENRSAQDEKEFSGLTPGTYDVYVIAKNVDPVCEKKIGTEVILEPSQLNATVTKANITCNGANNGSLTLSEVVGGTHPEMPTQAKLFRLDKIGTSVGDVAAQSGLEFTNLTPGSYEVFVIAENVTPTCERSLGVYEIFEPSALTATIMKSNISCFGAANGSIQLNNVNGGTHPELESQNKMFRLDKVGTGAGTPQSGNEFTSLSAGTYDVYIIADGVTPACSVKVETVEIFEPTELAATVAKANITCNGSNNGTITLSNVSGGTHGEKASQTKLFRLNKVGSEPGVAQSGLEFTNLTPGTYDVYVIAEGVTPTCEKKVDTKVIFEPSALSATVTKLNISCNGANNGKITLSNVSGGTHAEKLTQTKKYRADKVNGAAGVEQSGLLFENLTPGTYDVYVIADGVTPACSVKVGSPVIYEPTLMTAEVAKTNITCNGANDGTITVSNPGGGFHPETPKLFTNFFPAPRYPNGIGGSQTRILTRDVDVNSRFAYFYGNERIRWSNDPARWEMFNTVMGLINYSTEDVAYPWLVTEWLRSDNNTADAGVSVKQYIDRKYRLDKVGTSVGDVPAQTGLSFTGLSAGTYDVYVIADGVSPTCEVKVDTKVIYEPLALTATVAKTNISCKNAADGTITISDVSGGTHAENPVQAKLYRIDKVNGSVGTPQSELTFTNLTEGSYDVYVIADGVTPACSVKVDTKVIWEPTNISASADWTNLSCRDANDGTITVYNTYGGAHPDANPRTYNYIAELTGGGTVGPQTSGTFTGLLPGQYTISVIALAATNTPACTTVVATRNILNPTTITASVAKTNITCNGANDGTITVSDAAGGTHPQAQLRTYNYMIARSGGSTTGPQASASFTGLQAGTYTVSVVALATGESPACTTNVSTQVIHEPTTVTQPSVAVTNISCDGGSDGKLQRSPGTAGGTHAEAGTRTYNYRIVKRNSVFSETNETGLFTGLTAGVYDYYVIALASGATVPACTTNVGNYEIYTPSAITATVAKTNFTCNNANDGTITVSSPAGGTHGGIGTRSYEYIIAKSGGETTGPQALGSFTGLTAGTYTVSVVALASGSNPECVTVVSTQEILNPTVVSASVAKSNITCNTANDGTITVTAPTGGTHADAATRTYEYIIARSGGSTTGPQATGSFTGLTDGTYTVSVVALATGSTPACTTNVSTQVIMRPTTITADVAKTNITCNNANDGTITVSNAAGGTHADANPRTYKYMIAKSGGATTGPQASASFTGLDAGTYTVSVVADATGSTPACTTAVSTQIIYNPTAISSATVAVAKTNISCNNANNGTITVTSTAGGTHADAPTRTYKYKITEQGGATVGPQTSTSFGSLPAGRYIVTVIADAVGSTPACTSDVHTLYIRNPEAITATVTKLNASCNNADNGSITATATGGTHVEIGSRSFTYRAMGTSYDVTNATGSFTNLVPGTYTIYAIAAAENGGEVPVCTTEVATRVIYNPTPVTATVDRVNISCNGSNNGSITVSNAAGGNHADAETRTYSYRTVKSGGGYAETNATGSFTGLTAGTYTVSVIAADICCSVPACTTEVATRIINEPTAITATVSKTNISCNGAANGTITAVASGGTHADAGTRTYSYRAVKSGGGYDETNGTGSFTALSAGTYTISAIAAESGSGLNPVCTTQVSTQVIYEPLSITATVSKTNVSCNGSNDGTISASATGGTHADAASRSFTYRAVRTGGGYDETNGTGSFSALTPGTYTIFAIAAASGEGVNPVCTTQVSSQIIFEPSTITASVAKSNITCNNANDGTITITNAAGGVHAEDEARTYRYMIARTGGSTVGPQVSGSFTGLQAGTYTVSVVALASGSSPACTTNVSTQVIFNPTVVTATVAKTNISCFSANDGTIAVSAPQGGTHEDADPRSYEYMIARAGGATTGPQESGSFTGLQDGTYTVSVVALATGSSPACTTAVSTQVILRPSAITANAAKKNISCNDANNGSISVGDAAGGIHDEAGSRNYTYRIVRSGGGYDQTGDAGAYSGLSAGTYTVSVIAASANAGVTPACTTDVATLEVFNPTPVTATVEKTNITCNGTVDGTITVSNTAGGTHGDIASRTYEYRISRVGGATTAFQESGSFTGLQAGTYTVTVLALGTGVNPACTTDVSELVIFEPSVLTGTVSKTNVLCKNAADGTITISNASGGTHAEREQTYEYRLDNVSNEQGDRAAQANNVFTGLAPGTYDVYVIAAGVTPVCEVKLSTQVITEPTQLTAAPAVTSNYAGAQLRCPNSSDGALAANPGGGTTPYTYLWEKNVSNEWTAIDVAKRNLENPTDLNAGTYRVTVTDANQCFVTREVEIVPPAPAVILTVTSKDYNGRDVSCFGSTDGEITVTATGGTGDLKYSKDGGLTWLTGGTTNQNGDPTYTFTGLGAGEYTIIVQDVNGCNSDAQAKTLENPPVLTITSLTTNGPVNAGESLTFTATVVGGTRDGGANKYSYSWAKPRPAANMPSGMSETVNANDVVTTFTIPVTTADDNGFSTNYILTVTDANGCQTSLSVTPIVYPATIYVATTGNDATGDGRAVNPLKTIQKAIDVADATNTIEVQAGTYDESPVVNKQLTINGTNTSQLGTGRYFIYGTTSTITWGTGWPTSVWDNLGMNGDASSVIGTVMNKVNSNSNATLWLLGNITWNATITVSKQLAIRGATASAGVPSYTGCDIVPPTTVTFTGTGADTVLFKFTGSSTKSLRDLILVIPQSGRFAEIPNTNSCNVDPVTNVRFDWDHDGDNGTALRRMFGVTNGSFSVNQKFDVAKLIYDVEDNGYGTGRVVFGNNGPLPWNSLEIGWKAEDGSVENNGDKIKTLEPMKGAVKLQSLISNSRRPALNTGNNYNGKWSMDFDATASQYLEANTSTEINGGSKKTLFVAFRPLVGADDQIIYKHGDHQYGMSIVHLSDGRISMNIYDGTTAAKRESWIFESAATHSSNGFDDKVVIAQLYFNGDGDLNADRRVGASLDVAAGRLTTDVNHTGTTGYVGSGDFSSTTLTTPATIGPANVVALGARSGSMYYAGWNAGTATVTDNSFTSTGRSLFYKGSIAEVLMLNTAAESARDAAYCYLRNKYFSGDQDEQNGLDKRVIAGESTTDIEMVSAWPNPADDQVSIEALIPNAGPVTVTLRDALGRVAQVLLEDNVPGRTLLPINADVRNVMSGAYVIHVSAAGDVNLSLPIIIRH